MIAPGVNGFQEDMNEPYAYDPEQSKQLLEDAGYAEGFPVTLDCPNDRYVNDEAICTAIVPMLERIGIDVTLNAQTKSLHFNKIGQATGNDTSFYMLGWTPGSYDAYNALQNLMTMDGEAQGTWNCGRYSEPQGRGADRPDRDRDRRGQAQRADPRGVPDPQGRRSATSRCTSRRWPGACAATR